MSSGSKSTSSTLIFFAFVLFLFIIKFGFHELWKDEWQAWLIATDTSWRELIDLLPQEGHPSLWFLLLRGINFLKELLFPAIPDVYVLQSFHFLLTAGVYYLLFKKMELPLWMKAGFGFTYFLFFEYGIINRSYILIPLFIYAVIHLLQKEKKSYPLIAIMLFLLCQVEIYGLIAAGSLLLYIWLNDFDQGFFNINKTKIMLATSLLAGVALFYVTVAPKETKSTATFEQASSLGIENFFHSIQAITFDTFYPGLFPTALSDFNFLLMLAGLGLLSAFYFIFKKDKNLLLSYGMFVIIFWVFSSIIYIGGMRHWGMHVIALIGFLSLYYYKYKKLLSWQNGIIISTIIFMGMHNLKIIGREINEPFSNSKEAGIYIKKHFHDIPVLGINKPYMTPAIGYAEKRFHTIPSGDTYSYFKWKEKQYIPNMKDLVEFKKLIDADRMLVVFNKPLPAHIFTELKPVRAFNKPSIREEDFYLYILD